MVWEFLSYKNVVRKYSAGATHSIKKLDEIFSNDGKFKHQENFNVWNFKIKKSKAKYKLMRLRNVCHHEPTKSQVVISFRRRTNKICLCTS